MMIRLDLYRIYRCPISAVLWVFKKKKSYFIKYFSCMEKNIAKAIESSILRLIMLHVLHA